MTSQPYEPELGQLVFGREPGEFDLGKNEAYVVAELLALRALVGDDKLYDVFKNKTFLMCHYYWGDCTCEFGAQEHQWTIAHPHAEECIGERYAKEQDRFSAECPVHIKVTEHMRAWSLQATDDKTADAYMHCDCGHEEAYGEWVQGKSHTAECREVLPNFRYKDIEIRWYKHIGRGMSANRIFTMDELRDAFTACRQSLT
jgi:hypothetical protein